MWRAYQLRKLHNLRIDYGRHSTNNPCQIYIVYVIHNPTEVAMSYIHLSEAINSPALGMSFSYITWQATSSVAHDFTMCLTVGSTMMLRRSSSSGIYRIPRFSLITCHKSNRHAPHKINMNILGLRPEE